MKMQVTSHPEYRHASSSWRQWLIYAVACFCWNSVANAQVGKVPEASTGPSASPSAGKSAGKSAARLLDDIPSVKKSGKKSDKSSPATASSIAGEDLGSLGEQGRGAGGLNGVLAQMQLVRERLLLKDAAISTQQSQQQIVEELEKLIRAAEQQKSAASSAAVGKPSSEPDEPPGGDLPQAARSSKPDTQTASEPTPGPPRSTGTADEIEGATNRREIWGQLPEHLRRQIGNISPEMYLPKYERMISEYYRRLSDPERQ